MTADILQVVTVALLLVVVALLLAVLRSGRDPLPVALGLTDSSAAEPQLDSILSREAHFGATRYWPDDTRVRLIGYRTVRIEPEARPEFNDFFWAHFDVFRALPQHHYDPETGDLRVYFPVRGAVVSTGDQRLEASEHGGLSLTSEGDLNSLQVFGRRQTTRVTGGPSTIEDGVILLRAPVPVEHLAGDDLPVFDFGERQIGGHHDHGHHDHGQVSGGKVSCHPNHGGMNCSTAFGIDQGRCPFNPDVCMDYNGLWTDCKNYDQGWKRYRNFIGSDCAIALSMGHCWNEI